MKNLGYTVDKKNDGLYCHSEKTGEHLKIEVLREDIFRVKASKKAYPDKDPVILERDLRPLDISRLIYNRKENVSTLSAGRAVIGFDCINGKLSLSAGDKLLLKGNRRELSEESVYIYTTDGEEPIIDRVKTVDGERNFIKNLKKKEVRKAYRAKLFFDLDDNEELYGLGQGEDGIYGLRHHSHYLYQHNMRIPMPVLYSDMGYGVLADCGCLMTFEDDVNGSYLFFDTVDELSYCLIAAETPDKFVDALRFLTGKASMLPDWAFGYVQSKEQYYSADEMLDVVKRYRNGGIPLDCIVQDWNSWRPDHWGEKKLDKERYGNVQERMKEIHGLNVHTMVSVWPNMNSNTDDYKDFMDKGLMLNDLATYDAFNEEARKIYWEQAKSGLYDMGFDSWWCDSTEPFSGPDWGGEVKREPWERYTLVGGEHKKYLDPARANIYSLYHAKGIFENQRKDAPDKRMLNLTRSGYISGQKYGAMLWSGDTCAKWETLKKQITEGLNMGLSGYPYWTLDIGAFFTVGDKWQNRGCGCNADPSPKWFWQGDYNEGVKDAGYRELYVRWLEYGVFLPMFRSHGTDTPREIWNFGAPGDPEYDAIERAIKLRYLLMPYIYSMALSVHIENFTILRSLLFDFMEDKKARKIHDEFMFGKSLLICPVTEPMFYDAENTPLSLSDDRKGRSCYLPGGAGWSGFFDETHYDGGEDVFIKTPLDKIPVFVRDGSIIPMQEGLTHASKRDVSDIIISVYPGADGGFKLYEDFGDGYGYEKNEYSMITFDWKDGGNMRNGRLSIGERNGSYPGMPEKRTFRIRVKGLDEKTIEYKGRALAVDF